LENEKAPREVEEVIVDPSVKIIREGAFIRCRMKKCTMGDNVEGIEGYAFYNCYSIKNLRLSRGLRYIEECAFVGCHSIECLFIPPNVGRIEDGTFGSCKEMKILVLPTNIDLDQIGHVIVLGCGSLLAGRTVRIGKSNLQVHRWLKHRYDHLPSLRLCADPDVTAAMIQQFIEVHGTAAFYQTDNDHGLTPLHILTCYNGFAADHTIMTCFSANPAALFIRDRKRLTPLDNLWNESRVDMIVHLMQDLCVNYRRRKKIWRLE